MRVCKGINSIEQEEKNNASLNSKIAGLKV